MVRNKHKGASEGNSTIDRQNRAQGAGNGLLRRWRRRIKFAWKINTHSAQISKSVFYKMFSRTFQNLQIYFYTFAENPA